MRKHLLIALFALLLVLPLVNAAIETPALRSFEKVDFKRDCTLPTEAYCGSGYECNLTIIQPDETLLINNQNMTNQISFHNISITPLQLGPHRFTMICTNGTDSGSSTFSIPVTPDGRTGYAIYYFLIIILSYGVMVFGVWKRDITISILSTLALYFVGTWIMFNGIDIFKNDLTFAFSLVTLGIAGYLSVRMAHEYILD